MPALFFSVSAAVLTALWALFIRAASFRTMAAAFLLATPLFIFILAVFPAKKEDESAASPLLSPPQQKTDWLLALLLALVFVLYQTALYLAVAADGPQAQAVVNLNVVIIVAHAILTKEAAFTADDLSVAAASVLYVALAFYISYAGTHQ